MLAAAVRAFAARGYYGTTTADVAKGAGISQAYVYRLFPDKEALFVAVVEHCLRLIRERLGEGVARARSTEPGAVLAAMAEGYARLVNDRDALMVLMHATCATSEPPIRDAVQGLYSRLVEYVRSVSGASEEDVQAFFARGFLCNATVAIGATEVDAPWARTLLAGIRHY
ncbi:hypothetical protein Misp01_23900 [Microtetraspora sp. NBRC 13810]|nr:hypothetical protein Misp01_23900 [Microtetraspora sp. NBRC 13810]